jgi:hypothetical protein
MRRLQCVGCNEAREAGMAAAARLLELLGEQWRIVGGIQRDVRLCVLTLGRRPSLNNFILLRQGLTVQWRLA